MTHAKLNTFSFPAGGLWGLGHLFTRTVERDPGDYVGRHRRDSHDLAV